MENTKNLHIVFIRPSGKIDRQELMRARAVIRDFNGRDLEQICDSSNTIVCLAYGSFEAINKELNDVIASSTELFIVQLSAPYTTKGFSRQAFQVAKYLNPKDMAKTNRHTL